MLAQKIATQISFRRPRKPDEQTSQKYGHDKHALCSAGLSCRDLSTRQRTYLPFLHTTISQRSRMCSALILFMKDGTASACGGLCPRHCLFGAFWSLFAGINRNKHRIILPRNFCGLLSVWDATTLRPPPLVSYVVEGGYMGAAS